MNAWFMLSSSVQARLWDMPISRAAAEIDPVSRMLSSSFAVPGPIRAPDSKTMLILTRGSREYRTLECRSHGQLSPATIAVVQASDFGFSGGVRRGTRLIGAESFPRRSKPCRASASSPFEVALPDTRASFSSLVSPMPFDPRPIVVDYMAGPLLN